MNSIRTKVTVMTVTAIIIAMIVAAVLGVTAIRHLGTSNANEMLLLLCESGEKNLDSYFESVEQSVEMVSAYVESDLAKLEDEDLDDEEMQRHLNDVSDIFKKMTYKTNGILTYYYRTDPTVFDTAKGFWYVNTDGEGFKEHEVTDITQYDMNDTSKLVWFTVPRATGKAVWLPPYVTENLDERVLSYNTPIYYNNKFIGVVGIEIDYTTMAKLVDSITLYENGYAFINDADGTIIYHPRMSVEQLSREQPKVPDGMISEDKFFTYTYEGVKKQGVWLPLSNGMRLNVTVPVSEINADWHRWIKQILIIFSLLLIVFILFILRFTGHITGPLRDLTGMAKQVDEGNYDVKLDYDGNDEVGVLTRTFSQLISNLKVHIKNLNDLAYADALTSVHNKGAFDIFVRNLEEQLDGGEKPAEFAVCVFDCNGLKEINDEYGHDKGDIYLKAACDLICKVFNHSPVFRLGGDEFAAVLQNDGYQKRGDLMEQFDKACAEEYASEDTVWQRVDIARGMAVYDPVIDFSVNDVVRRADRLMYENKRESKKQD